MSKLTVNIEAFGVVYVLSEQREEGLRKISVSQKSINSQTIFLGYIYSNVSILKAISCLGNEGIMQHILQNGYNKLSNIYLSNV